MTAWKGPADTGGGDREGGITHSSKTVFSVVPEEMQFRLKGQPG